MKNLLVVDVQPAYDNFCRYVTKNVIKAIEKAQNPVVMFVGGGLTNDDELAVMDYYMSNGMSEETLDTITFIEKDYAFFRGWMDAGVGDGDIVKVIRKLYSTGYTDSRDLKLPEHLASHEECIWLPDLDTDIFTGYTWNLCGGGRNECLKEIELWLRALKVKYRPIQGLIYG